MRNAQSRGTRVETGKLCPPLLCGLYSNQDFLALLEREGGSRKDDGRVYLFILYTLRCFYVDFTRVRLFLPALKGKVAAVRLTEGSIFFTLMLRGCFYRGNARAAMARTLPPLTRSPFPFRAGKQNIPKKTHIKVTYSIKVKKQKSDTAGRTLTLKYF